MLLQCRVSAGGQKHFCSHSTALVWAGQPLGLCLWWLMGHQVHFKASPRSGREHAHLLGISCLLTAPWSYICACRDLSPPQNTSGILVKMAGIDTAKHFLTFEVDRHPTANCKNHCHWFQWEHDGAFNEVSYKDMDLTPEAIPDVLVICSWRNPSLLSQPAIYQIQQLILELSLFFY